MHITWFYSFIVSFCMTSLVLWQQLYKCIQGFNRPLPVYIWTVKSDWLWYSNYCVFGMNKLYSFNFVVVCVWICMFLKKVVKSSLLSKYERLTPNIDQVMPVWKFRNRAQNTKISEILRGLRRIPFVNLTQKYHLTIFVFLNMNVLQWGTF